MPVGAKPGSVLVDVLSASHTTYTVGTDGTMNLTVPAQSGMILVPQDQVVSGT